MYVYNLMVYHYPWADAIWVSLEKLKKYLCRNHKQSHKLCQVHYSRFDANKIERPTTIICSIKFFLLLLRCLSNAAQIFKPQPHPKVEGKTNSFEMAWLIWVMIVFHVALVASLPWVFWLIVMLSEFLNHHAVAWLFLLSRTCQSSCNAAIYYLSSVNLIH